MDRYYPYSTYLRQVYGYRVYRVGIDAGFSCPNRDADRIGGCIYCDAFGGTAAYQQKDTGKHEELPVDEDRRNMDSLNFRLDSVKKQIESGVAFLNNRYQPEGLSLYLQSFSNTFAPIEELRTVYDFALRRYSFTEFIISTRPDCINGPVISLLREFKDRTHELWVELGVQSACDRTLEFMNRGHTSEDVLSACRLLRKEGIPISLHIILGLPGEGCDALDATAAFIRKIHPEAIKIHNLHIPAGTQLEEMYLAGEAVTASTERHISRLVYLLEHIPADIVIQRIVCDTPKHRLAAPRNFARKAAVIQKLKDTLEVRDTWQGRHIGWEKDQVGERGKGGRNRL